jgi:hypothetical protein
MMGINQEFSDRLAQRMYVDPGDEDLGQCFFNARRALFRLTRLDRENHETRYTEGFTVYFNYQQEFHCVAAHAWVTAGQGQVVDPDYAALGRYTARYFPGLHFSAEEVYQRLKLSDPPGTSTAFGLMPMGLEMTRAYVQACEYLQATWPEEVTPHDRQHLNQWRETLAVLIQGGQ